MWFGPWKSVRFGLLIDPLEMTGSFLAVSQYPVFKVQAAADSLHILRFCPPLAARTCFGGEEIHYSFPLTVSTSCPKFFRDFLSPLRPAFPGNENAPRFGLGRRSETAFVRLQRRLGSSPMDRLPAALDYQHALRSPSRCGVCGAVLYTLPLMERNPTSRTSFYPGPRNP